MLVSRTKLKSIAIPDDSCLSRRDIECREEWSILRKEDDVIMLDVRLSAIKMHEKVTKLLIEC
jgi:hypothetical protein